MTLPPLAPETRNLIDGRALRRPATGQTFDNLNPTNGERPRQCASTARGTTCSRAVEAARRAFDETELVRGSRVPLEVASASSYEGHAREEKEQLRSIVVHEAGAPGLALRRTCTIDAPDRHDGVLGRSRDVVRVRARGMSRRALPRTPTTAASSAARPSGVVGAITPWNVPLYLNIAKIGPALASGCTHRAEARARHAVVRDAPRQDHHREDRHSGRRDQHRRVFGSSHRRDPVELRSAHRRR